MARPPSTETVIGGGADEASPLATPVLGEPAPAPPLHSLHSLHDPVPPGSGRFSQSGKFSQSGRNGKAPRHDPGLANLTGAEQERLWAAREAFASATKALKNLRLYPREHPLVGQELQAFADQLRACLQLLGGTLRLGVREGALLLDGLPAYEEPDLPQSLAHRLFVDGVRELTLTDALPAGGPEALLLLLHALMAEPQIDAAASLDEHAPEGVLFEATSALAEAWEPPDFLSRGALERIEALNREVEGMVAIMTSGVRERAEVTYELTDGAREAEVAKRLGSALAEEDRGQDPFRLDESELTSLKNEAARWGPQELLLVVLEACLTSPVPLPPDDLAWAVREAQAHALGGKELDLLLMLVARLERAVAEGAEPPPSPELVALVAERREWFVSDSTRRRLIDVVQSGFLGGAEALLGLLELAGFEGRALAGELFLATGDAALEERLLGFLGLSLVEDPTCLLALLAPDLPAAKVKSALFLLGKRGQGLDGLPDLLSLAAAHPDPEVKGYVEHLFRSLTDEGKLESVLDALHSPQRSDRLLALQTLVDMRALKAFTALTQVIEADEFLARDLEERTAFMLAVRVVGADRAFGVYLRQKERKTILFNRQAAKEVRQMAEDGLRELRESRAGGRL